MNNLKMYIAVLDEVPDHMVPVLVAHATLGAHKEFSRAVDGKLVSRFNYESWLKYSFKKVVLKVNHKEFEKIKTLEDVYLAHENSTLDGKTSCAVVCPRYELHNVLTFAKMWKPGTVIGLEQELVRLRKVNAKLEDRLFQLQNGASELEYTISDKGYVLCSD